MVASTYLTGAGCVTLLYIVYWHNLYDMALRISAWSYEREILSRYLCNT